MTNNTIWPKRGRGSMVAIDPQSPFSPPGRSHVWPTKRGLDSPWPFKADDVSPLEWWRTLPSHTLGPSEHALLLATLKSINVLHAGSDLKSALAGDPMAAVDVAFSLMPVKELTLTVDIAMTALCHLSLAPNATVALVMAQVTGLTDFDHGLSIDLALSWLRAFEERDRSGTD